MLKNYLKFVVRILKKHRGFALINIIGLAVALACSLLIFIHVKDEMSFEEGFSKADQVYRITIASSRGDTYQHGAASPPPLGHMAQEQIPEIKQVVRFARISDAVLRYSSADGTIRRFREEDGFFADATALQVAARTDSVHSLQYE